MVSKTGIITLNRFIRFFLFFAVVEPVAYGVGHAKEVVGLDEGEDLAGVGEDELVAFDGGEDFAVFGLDLLALEAGELAEAHFEDGGGLDVVEAEALEHAGLGLGVVVGG